MFSKKLIHANSYYKTGDQTSSNWVYANNDPSLTQVRKIELLSASFLNSETNVNSSNNTLQFIKREALTRMIKPNSVYNSVSNRSTLAGTNGQNPNGGGTDLLSIEYKWYKPPLSEDYYLVLFLDPKKIDWAQGGPPNVSIILSSIQISITAVTNPIQFQVMPRQNDRDEVCVFISHSFTAVNTHLSIQFTCSTPAGSNFNFNCSSMNADYLDFDYANDPSVVTLSDRYALGLIPVKNSGLLRGFQYIVFASPAIQENTLQYVYQEINGSPLSFQLFTSNQYVGITTISDTAKPLYRDDFFDTGAFGITIQHASNDKALYYFVRFSLQDQLVQAPLQISQITIPAKEYVILDLIIAIQAAFLAQGITMSKDGSTWFSSSYGNSLRFSLDEYCIINVNNYGVYNPIAYLIGLNTSGSTDMFSLIQQMNSIPDLSGIIQIHLCSNTITQSDRTLNGNSTSDNSFCVLPVLSTYGKYNLWNSQYPGQFSRNYQFPTNLNRIDLQIRDITGRQIYVSGDTCLCFEITYQQ